MYVNLLVEGLVGFKTKLLSFVLTHVYNYDMELLNAKIKELQKKEQIYILKKALASPVKKDIPKIVTEAARRQVEELLAEVLEERNEQDNTRT